MKNKFILFIGIIGLLLFTRRVEAATEMPEEVSGTITLTEDVTLDGTFTVSDGEDITLDLSGYTLTTTSPPVIRVEAGGTLNITGNGTVTYTGLYTTLVVYGTVVINNGTFISNGNVIWGQTDSNIEINGGTFIGSVDYPTLYTYGTVVINEGTFINESSNVVDGMSSSNIEINGGTFTGYNENYPTFYTYGTVVINGGTFSSESVVVYGASNSNIEINDGTFTGYSENYPTFYTYGTVVINGGTITSGEGNNAIRVKGAVSITDGAMNGLISVEDDGTLEITGGTFVNDSTDEDYNYLISNTSSNVVTISGGTYTYPSVLLSSDSTETAVIDSEVIGPLDLVNYAVSGAVITLNTSVDSDDTLDIPEGVKVLVPPTVSFKIKDITGDGTIDVTDDNYEIVYVDGYYIMRLKEVVEEVNPSTGIETPYIVCSIVIISSIILIILYKRKRYI